MIKMIDKISTTLSTLGIDKAALAKAVGVAPSTLRGILNGNDTASDYVCTKINAYLDGIANGTIPRPVAKPKKTAAATTVIPPDHLADIWQAYLDTRKAKRGANTDSCLSYQLANLEKYAPNDPDKQRAIVEQSINHAWVGLFPLKETPEWARNGETAEETYARWSANKARRENS